MPSLDFSLRWMAKVGLLTLFWVVLFRFSTAVFAALELTPRASLIFLPAALRVLYPLVFRRAGIAALFIGGYLVLPESEGPLLHRMTLAALSTMAPLVGIAICQAIRPIRSDLSGIRPADLFGLSIVCAISNSLILNAYLMFVGYPLKPVAHLAWVFVGDVLGTLIVLFGVALILTWATSRARPH